MLQPLSTRRLGFTRSERIQVLKNQETLQMDFRKSSSQPANEEDNDEDSDDSSYDDTLVADSIDAF